MQDILLMIETMAIRIILNGGKNVKLSATSLITLNY